MAHIKLMHKNESRKPFSPKTVTIGNQVWMAENLAIDSEYPDEGKIVYSDASGEYYYTRDGAGDVAARIPGWHLPTIKEWVQAIEACGGTIDRSSIDPESDATDDIEDNIYTAPGLVSKLRIYLDGFLWDADDIPQLGKEGYFWTADTWSSTLAYCACFTKENTIGFDARSPFRYCPVRLVKD